MLANICFFPSLRVRIFILNLFSWAYIRWQFTCFRSMVPVATIILRWMSIMIWINTWATTISWKPLTLLIIASTLLKFIHCLLLILVVCMFIEIAWWIRVIVAAFYSKRATPIAYYILLITSIAWNISHLFESVVPKVLWSTVFS